MAFLGSLSPEVLPEDAAAAAAERDSFGWYGETFMLAERLGALVLLRMAWESRQADGLRSQAKGRRQQGLRDVAAELEGQADRDEAAAMYQFLQAVLAPGEWDRFYETTMLAGASDEAITELIQRLIGVLSERPTRRPSASAGGPSMSLPGSPASSSGPSPAERQAAELFYAGSPA